MLRIKKVLKENPKVYLAIMSILNFINYFNIRFNLFFPRYKVNARLDESITSDGRESYLRGVLKYTEGEWIARLTGHQGSGNLLSLVHANGLLIIPAGVKSLPSGSELEAWLLD